MSQCKYSQCSIELDNPRANTCCDAHRKAWKREVQTPDPDNHDATATPDPDNSDPDTQPGHNPDIVPLVQPLHLLNCQSRGVNDCNLGDYMPAHDLPKGVVNRVSLPGDADYNGVAVL